MEHDGGHDSNGQEAAAPARELLPQIYKELRAMAGAAMRREDRGHTLQPTVLVHEVFLRLADQCDARIVDEAHLKSVAATAMRRVLVDHARARAASKRGGGRPDHLRTSDPPASLHRPGPEQLLELDDAIERLRDAHPRQARVVEMRYFGGMGFDQVAAVLGVSPNTAKNDWRFARAWLQRRLTTDPPDAGDS